MVIPSGTCSLPCQCFVIRPCSYNVQKPYAGGYHRSVNVQHVPNTGKTGFKRRDLAGVGNLCTQLLEYFRKKKILARSHCFCWLSVLIRPPPPRLCFACAFGYPLQEWSLPHQPASPWFGIFAMATFPFLCLVTFTVFSPWSPFCPFCEAWPPA